MSSNISADLIWEVTRPYNAFLCKRKQSGGVQFSRDPMNLTNVHNRKYAGYCNTEAIGINAKGDKLEVKTKLPKKANYPAKMYHTTTFSSSTPSRKIYKSVVNGTTRKGYRSDLRAEAVARASAVKRSQREVKAKSHPVKLRGKKAKQAKEAAASS
ncbi:ribosomal protein L28e [Piedraia hortae CBS 480.64]|uniref:Ribosomal protein L28e n=1 Tax=Piedraia hortae CBS 480.64 TaxID=1314780 RepID=A0A6A7BTX7_9PEZI|nr:ribosomal protein L28e [Piedraia hortae CBS 480.64]